VARDAMSARPVRMAVLVAAGLALLEIVGAAGIVAPPHDMLRPASLGPFLACGLFVVFLFFVCSRPRLVEGGAVLAVAAAIALATGGPMARASAFSIGVLVGASLGEASFLVLAARIATRKGEARREAIERLATASLLPAFILTTGPGMALTTVFHPLTYDGAAYHVDGGLGFEASFAVGRAFIASDALQLPCVLAYACLPFSFGALLLVAPRVNRAPPRADLLESFLLAGVLGCALYHLCPVAGPYYAFTREFPVSLPLDVSSDPFVIPPAPRDAVPSLHAGWAILALWHARSRGLGMHVAAGVSLVLVLLGALGLGEHYVGDFAVAVPFVVAVDAMATHGVRIDRAVRWSPIAVGAALVAVWIVALRCAAGWIGAHASVTWALMLTCVALPLALRARLQRCALDVIAGPSTAP
jgi:hypothetical protein